MPWTFAHPAVVLPLKRLCPRYLSWPGLFVGSLTPDFGYYINPLGVGSTAHTFKGSFLVCIPAGLVFLAFFYFMRRPIWLLLPARHRHAAAPLLNAPLSMDTRFALVASVSVLIGAWTHIAWDSFTHRGTWAFWRFTPLRELWFNIGSVHVPGYSVLQHSSTLVGTACLGLAYIWWLRRRPPDKAVNTGDGWRYLVMLGLPIVSFGIAIAFALPATTRLTGMVDVPAFVFRSAIFGMSVLVALLCVYSAGYHVRNAYTHFSCR